MLSKKQFKELYEDDGIVKDKELRVLFKQIEVALEDNENKDWLSDRKEWLSDLSLCLLHYVNDVERDIHEKKLDKFLYGLAVRNDWLNWVESASNFKNILNDLRLHSEEIKVLVVMKLKQVNKAVKFEEHFAREAKKNIPKRYVIHASLNNGNQYENIIIYSDKNKIIDAEIALKYIDFYQSQRGLNQSVVNYRAFVASKEFYLTNSKMIEASSLI